MRTFIAVDLEKDLKGRLSRLIGDLSLLTRNVRWVRNEGMHLTLKFLGQADEEKICEVGHSLERLAGAYKPFPLSLQGTGSFPPGSTRPRVIWVGVEAGPTLFSIQKDIEGEMERLGFPVENRPYHPHLTLGRVKSPSELKGALDELHRHRTEDFGTMEVKNLVLFESLLKSTGAEYRIIKESALG